MAENCNHDCSSCGVDCPSRDPSSFLKQLSPGCSVNKVIAVMSGKGGVGKSSVTAMLAVEMQRRGYHVGILDADVTGPSIPKAFGIYERAHGDETTILPATTNTGIDLISLNLLVENETDPVVWRGPVISNLVTQFWTNVRWNDVDFLFVDMPPGTGDVPLTVFQSIPVDAAIVVTSPQELVGMIVEKAYNMASMMNIKVEGVVENYSYFECPDCGKRHEIFGKSHIDETAKRLGIPAVAKMPVDPEISDMIDSGSIELYGGDWLSPIADRIEKL
ncbi:MAG: Mrp/NBP35 family ATP-binding protein [Oscillospiraceae bacterium]|nr:Mrp/NBP35 family ATP-binding protein [Oscillospiraceae bacterium]